MYILLKVLGDKVILLVMTRVVVYNIIMIKRKAML